MKRHHTIFVLLTLFFTGLIVLWWADYAEIPTEQERLERSGLVLPTLLGIRPDEIRRVEVVQPHATPAARVVLERRDGNRWQMVEPVDAAADPNRVETLVRTLKSLPRSRSAGTISGTPATYGFEPPTATVRLFGAGDKELAALDVGKALKDKLYVRPSGHGGIEVVDPVPFREIDAPAADWRDRSIFDLSTFQVAGVAIRGPDRDLKAERAERHWRLTSPVTAPADDEKVEGLIAGLLSLRVADGVKGFAADNVKDFAPYGLDTPALTITLQPARAGEAARVVKIGNAAPVSGDEERVFARRGDEDDVILLDGKGFHELGRKPNDLRSKSIADINPARVERIEYRTPERELLIERSASGWEIRKPSPRPADVALVQNLLTRLAELQTSEFLDPSQAPKPGLDPPTGTLRVWQAEAPTKPRLTLQIGRHDASRKSVYARVEGDTTVLALPDVFLDVLPTDALVYRDRAVLTLPPGQVARLSVARQGQTYAVEPAGSAGQPNQWQMIAPVEAPADDEVVTKALAVLANLRAAKFVTETPGDGHEFGLDSPTLSITWTTRPEPSAKGSTEPVTDTLRVGSSPKGQSKVSYARLMSGSLVFLLDETAVQPFLEEFHTPRVLSFKAKEAGRIALRWPSQTLSFVRQPEPRTTPIAWRPAPEVEAHGFDLSRLGPLVTDLSRLRTRKFLQYDGPITDPSGLASPRLTVEVAFADKGGTRTLRVGNPYGGGEFMATTATGGSGPVFLLSATGWTDLIELGQPKGELPEDVFAPLHDPR